MESTSSVHSVNCAAAMIQTQSRETGSQRSRQRPNCSPWLGGVRSHIVTSEKAGEGEVSEVHSTDPDKQEP